MDERFELCFSVFLDLVGAGVCHSDYHLIDGHEKVAKIPWVMGHEGAGVVREVGPGVRGVAAGDKIILSLDAMCGHCRNCSSGKPALCETHPRDPLSRMRKAGEPVYHARPTFAEQSIVLADACVKVPDDTQLKKACLISCGVITGIGAVVNRARVEQGRHRHCAWCAPRFHDLWDGGPGAVLRQTGDGGSDCGEGCDTARGRDRRHGDRLCLCAHCLRWFRASRG